MRNIKKYKEIYPTYALKEAFKKMYIALLLLGKVCEKHYVPI